MLRRALTAVLLLLLVPLSATATLYDDLADLSVRTGEVGRPRSDLDVAGVGALRAVRGSDDHPIADQ